MEPGEVLVRLNPAFLPAFFYGENEAFFCLFQFPDFGVPGFVLGELLVREAKLVVEFADDDEIGLEAWVILDAFPGVLQLLERFDGFAISEQAAALFEGILLRRSAPGEGCHQTNRSQKPAGQVGGFLRGPHGCWW